MIKSNDFQADWISAPGNTMADILAERCLSIGVFAKNIGRTIEYTQELLDGRVILTNDDAERLEKVLGGSSAFWINREIQYRADLRRIFGDQASDDARDWLKKFPISDMVKFGWIPNINRSVSKVAECLRFFDVASIDAWQNNFGNAVNMAAFRTSNTFSADTASVAAWLRQGEIESKSIACLDWDLVRFQEAIPKLRNLTRKNDPKLFIPLLKSICAECGVAVVIVRSPKGCRASGATRFLSPQKALMQLSFRYLSDDHFWFTFFHEAAHLIIHSKETLFLEGADGCSSKEEDEANAFSANILVPAESQQEMKTLGVDAKKVMRFARNIGVSAGVVVGQMQHLGYVPRTHLNKLKVRFSWGF